MDENVNVSENTQQNPTETTFNSFNQQSSMQTTDFISKEAYDRKVSELNAARKKAEEALSARMSEEEKIKAAQEEQKKAFEDMQKELSRLKNEKTFLANGFDSKTSSALAESFVGGDIDGFISIHNKWFESKIADLEAENKQLKMAQIPAINTGLENAEIHNDIDLATRLAKNRSASMENQNNILKNYM